jgi:hypothetical protein
MMLLGREGTTIFTTRTNGAAGFFRIVDHQIDQNGDADADGIDDVFELSHSDIMDPLRGPILNRDSDGDGISDYEEYINGWNPMSIDSPTPVQLARVPGGQKLIAMRLTPNTDLARALVAPTIPGLIRILPEVSVNDRGVMAFIAELSNGSGGTNLQIFTSRRMDDGAVVVLPVLTDAQAASVVRIGPGLQINNSNHILVRVAFQDNSPLGVITTTFVRLWDGNQRGVFQTIESAEPLNLFAPFRIIDSRLTLNNLGSVAFFAEGRLNVNGQLVEGRWLMGKNAGGYVPTPLSATTVNTPMALSDADTLVLRIGDATSGSIRLFGLPDIGNRQISRIASSVNGFSSLGLRPGISDDGRVVAFFAEYSGPTNSNIGSQGAGIFAMVHTNPIVSANVAGAKLVRVGGVAFNGRLDPGETWRDANANGVVDVGEDEGVILGFFPDQAVGVSNDGLITFASQVSASSVLRSTGPPEATSTVVGVKLRSYHIPTPGPAVVAVSMANGLPAGIAFDTFNLHDPIAGSGASYCALSATDSTSGQSVPILCSLLAFEIAADIDDDGSINELDQQAKSTRPLVVPLKLEKPLEEAYRKVLLRISPVRGATFKLRTTGSGKVVVMNDAGGVILGPDSTETPDLTAFLTGEGLALRVIGQGNGSVELVLIMELGSTVREDRILIKVANADVVFRNGNQALAAIINYGYTHGGIDTGDDRVYDLAGPGIQTMQDVATFYSKAATIEKKRMVFSLAQLMGGRVVAKLHDNLKSGNFKNPTSQAPWNLFSTSENYNTANCLEWVHQQWKNAVEGVYAELSDAGQRSRFQRAYLDPGATTRDLVEPILVQTPGFPDPVHLILLLAAAENYVDWSVAREDRDAKHLWHNRFEGNRLHLYWPGYHDTPVKDIPLSVILFTPQVADADLNTITPQSYQNSAYFKEVAY